MSALTMLQILLTVLSLFEIDIVDGSKTLVMVNLIFRHGGRAPIHFFPNGKYQEKDYPNGAEWLTRKGMKVEYDLGLFLRKRYILDKRFLSKRYNHKEVFVQSSGKDRCLQSAELTMAGLFPPKGDQVWNSNIRWQPIPIHTSPKEKDSLMLAFQDECPRRNAIWKEIKNAAVYTNKIAESAELLRKLTNYTGMKIDIDNVWIIPDTVKVERFEGFNVPKWADKLWGSIIELDEWLTDYNFYPGDEIARLLGGPLLSKIINNMNAVSSKKIGHPYKMNIFSGHDFTLLGFAAALDMKIETPIKFGGCIMVELYHSKEHGYEVELYYRNDYSDKQPKPLKLKKCAFSCPLHEFIALNEKRLSTNRETECSVE